ncbi:MAG: hypothetical protein QGG73_09665 [Candidatus Hydrogenedentes bacterium]|jgi:uncharacterized Tic20 family protein|nr:hypothetical protein [Candidatus Hydrogenedentota bacterium]
MGKHIKAVAWLHIATAVLTILLKLLTALGIAGGGILGGIKTFNLFTVLLSPFGALLWFVFAVALSLLALLGGRGLLNRDSWSRPLMLVVGALTIFRFPLGTALGAYTIWTLWSAKSDSYFVDYTR